VNGKAIGVVGGIVVAVGALARSCGGEVKVTPEMAATVWAADAALKADAALPRIAGPAGPFVIVHPSQGQPEPSFPCEPRARTAELALRLVPSELNFELDGAQATQDICADGTVWRTYTSGVLRYYFNQAEPQIGADVPESRLTLTVLEGLPTLAIHPVREGIDLQLFVIERAFSAASPGIMLEVHAPTVDAAAELLATILTD
jgi:hypothetical protein